MTKKSLSLWLIALLVPGGALAVGAYYMCTKCWHKHTRPFMWKDENGKKFHYVCCTECAKEFAYDVDNMKVGKELPRDWRSDIATRSRASRLDGPVVETEGRERSANPDTRPAPAA